MARHARPHRGALAVVLVGSALVGGSVGLLLADGVPEASAVRLAAGPSTISGPPTVPDLTRPAAGPSASSTPTPTPTPTPSWREVLEALDAVRSAAFRTGDRDLLTRVYATGSPAHARDDAALTELVAGDLRAEGLRLVLDAVVVERATADEVVLRVRDRLPPYEVVAADGTVVEEPGRGPASWVVVLVADAGRWVVRDVRAA